jgi:hypothetical protein
VNEFTRALAPPFIGRRRDFYIPKAPSSSWNIPNVNAYKNVFFISYIYKPATSSHSKPGLFGMTTFTLLLTGSWTSPFATSELDFRQTPELVVLRSSWLCRFEIPDFRMFTTPRLHRFKIPENRMFATLKLRKSKILENRIFLSPEKHISRTSLNSTFRGWQVFLNSPIVIKWRSLAMDYKRSARRDATRFVESRISYREDNLIQDFFESFQVS